MERRGDPPRPLLEMALRCPKCREGTLGPIGEGPRMFCPNCGYETPAAGESKGKEQQIRSTAQRSDIWTVGACSVDPVNKQK